MPTLSNQMTAAFQNIVIPVDFSINTEVALRKAIDICHPSAALHLLYVQQPGGLTFRAAKKDSVAALSQLKSGVEPQLPEGTVHTWTSPGGSIQESIIARTKALGADLVVIGKNAHHSWMPFLNTVVPTTIARRTGCPVLTAKPGSLQTQLRSVLIPVSREIPMEKLELIRALRHKIHMKIFLVSFLQEGGADDISSDALVKTYRWLKDAMQCNVEYAVLHGFNPAKCILQYAEKVGADILVVHPQTETRAGWLNMQISDLQPPGSKVQVLTVQPHFTT